MTSLLSVIVVLAYAASGAAAPALPLRPIAGVAQQETVCANVVVHANSAIATALHDDAEIERALASLRTVDLDAGSPGRHAGLLQLARLAAEIDAGSFRAGLETKRLHAFADGKAGHPVALRAFADALDSALQRQHGMAVDLATFLHDVDVQDLRDVSFSPGGSRAAGVAAETQQDPTAPHGAANGLPAIRNGERTATSMARASAVDFERRMTTLRADEARAAQQSEAAVDGC